MPDPSHHHRDPHRLSEILNFGETESPWEPHELAAVFRHQLSAPMAFGPEDGAWAGGQAPATFGELLSAAHPPLPLLILMKDFARAHTLQPTSPIPREIATLLYYAAIAAALVRCDRRISGLTDGALRQGIAAVLAYDWPDQATRGLLAQGLHQLATSEDPT